MNTKSLPQKSLTLAGCLGIATWLALASSVQAAPGGTDITHFTVAAAMTNNGVELNAKGMVTASQKAQGHADNETLGISLSGLDTNMSYELVAIYDTDSNVVDVTSFTPDNNGKIMFNYRSLGNGHGGGKKSSALPDTLNPVSLIREVDIVDTNMQVVLSADLTSPDKLQYLIKRTLSNGTNSASLMIQANSQQTHFRLFSKDLMPNTDYVLALNEEAVQTNTTDANGKLNIDSLNNTPPYILDVRTVELWDTSSNVVLEADIP